MQTITINGITYKQIPQTETPPKQINNLNPELLALFQIYTAAFSNQIKTKTKTFPNVDIIKEFELVQNKKSNLSRSNREWITKQFLKLYKPI